MSIEDELRQARQQNEALIAATSQAMGEQFLLIRVLVAALTPFTQPDPTDAHVRAAVRALADAKSVYGH